MASKTICEMCYGNVEEEQKATCVVCELYFHMQCLGSNEYGSYCRQCILRSSLNIPTLDFVYTTQKKTPKPLKDPSKPEPDPTQAQKPPAGRVLTAMTPVDKEREEVRMILRKYAGRRYDEIPRGSKDKLESHYAIRHTDSYYQKKTIRIDAKKHQAAVPNIVPNYPTLNPDDAEYSTEVWNPHRLPPGEVDAYLAKAKQYAAKAKWQQNVCTGHHKTPEIKIGNSLEEIALKMLHLCDYSTKKALYCLLVKCDMFVYDIEKQMEDDAKQYHIYLKE